MARKHAIVSDDEEDVSSIASQKRARLETSTSEPTGSSPPVAGPSTTRRQQPAKSKKQRASLSDVEAEEEEDEDEMEIDMTPLIKPVKRKAEGEEEEESEWEEDEHDEEEAEVQRGLQEEMTQRKQAGSSRTAGNMEHLQLVNFMCHGNLAVDFNPKLNFIIGQNGSGKSAVLTALTLALGGKATTTQRATSLKDFVKEGAGAAQVILRLGNKGEEAFKPTIYGNSIWIERTIHRDGTGGYKIRGAKQPNKAISTKKEELQAILDHFGIMAESPLCILSQDNSRQFLQTSSPSAKYELFIRGSQLAQLSEDYDQVRNSLATITVQVKNKKQSIPELLRVARAAKARHDDAEKAERQGDKLRDLRHELGWSYVVEKEKLCENKRREVQKEEDALVRAQTKMDEAQGRLATAEADLDDLDKKRDESLTGRDEHTALDREREDLKRQLKTNTDRMKQLANESRQIRANQEQIKAQIADHQKKIDAEQARAAANSDVSRQGALAKLASHKAEIEALTNQNRALDQELAEMDRDRAARQAQFQQNNGQIDAQRQACQRAEANVRSVQGAQANPIQAYGNTMPGLLRAIDLERRWREKPVGPVGMFVKVRPEARMWTGVLESVLENFLGTFIVTSREDEQLLRRVAQQVNHPSVTITRTRRDMFDYRSGEPDESFLTVLRALTITDPFVQRTLINDAKVEKAILIESRAQADEIMRHPPRNVATCYSTEGASGGDAGSKIGGLVGGRQYVPLKGARGPPKLATDMKAALSAANNEKYEADQRLGELEQGKLGMQTEINHLARAFNAKRADRAGKEKRINTLQNAVTQINDTLAESESADVSAFLELKEESERELKATQTQLEGTVASKLETEAQTRPLLHRKEEIDREIQKLDEAGASWNAQLQELVMKRGAASQEADHYQRQVTKQSDIVDHRKTELGALLQSLETTTEQAHELAGDAGRIETRKKPDKLKQEITALENAIKLAAQKRGATTAEIRNEYANAMKAYQQADEAIKSLEQFVRTLKNSLTIRLSTWHNFRRQIALRAKMVFLFHLQKRGFDGRLSFNHEKQHLNVQVNTKDDAGTRKRKDVKGLSGGEKSFTTISLLLTLWDAVQCPLRCLDEFDIFMDAAFRRVSVGMMLDSALSANQIQYLFITPQDLAGITPGPDIRIHRLVDPERLKGGQQTLQFNTTDA